MVLNQAAVPKGILEVITRKGLPEGATSRLLSLQERREHQVDMRFHRKDKKWLMKKIKEGRILDAFFAPDNYTNYSKRFIVPMVSTNSAEFEPDVSVRFGSMEEARDFSEMIQKYRGIDALNEQRAEAFQEALEEQRVITKSGAEVGRGVADLIAESAKLGKTAGAPAAGDVSDFEHFDTAPDGYGDAESNEYLNSLRPPVDEFGNDTAVREQVERLKAKLPGIGDIVLNNKLPASGRFTAGTNTVEINPSAMRDLHEVEEVVFHEAVGHRMMHVLLGKDYKDTMLAAFQSLEDHIVPFFKQYNKDLEEGWYKSLPEIDDLDPNWRDNFLYKFDTKTDEGKLIATEEWIAMQTEYGAIDQTGWDRFLGWMRYTLRKLGFSPRWTKNDIDSLVNRAFQRAEYPMNSNARRRMRDAMHTQVLNKKKAPYHRRDLSYTDLDEGGLKFIGKMAPHKQKAGAKDMMHSVKKTFVQNIFDTLQPIASQIGESAYKYARLAKRKDGVLMSMLQYGGLRYNKAQIDDIKVPTIDIDTSLPGFFNTLKPLGTESERIRFFAWLAANRAEQNMQAGKERFFSQEDIEAGINLNQGTMRNADTGKKESREKIYKNIKRDFQRYNDSIINIGRSFGVFGKKAEEWETEFYVPFWREIERKVGDTRGVKGPVVFKELVDSKSPVYNLKGADMQTKDIFNNIIQNWSNILDASLKNQAGFEALRQAEKIINPENGLPLAERVSESTHRSVHVLVNGNKVHYHINDSPGGQALFDALASVHHTDIKMPGIEWMVKAKRLLTLGITSSPDFKISNAIRDSLTVMGTTDVGFNIAKNFFGGFNSLKDREFKGRMLASGGYMQFGFMENKDPKMAEKLLARDLDMNYVLNNPEANENMRQAMVKHGRIFRRLWSRYQDWGDGMENANRAALFKKKLGEGKSDLEAAYHARDVLDFSLNGKSQLVRAIIATVPFANALLQSKYKTYRGWRDYRQAFYTMALTIAGLSMAEYEMYGDDEDWKAREEWDKDTFFWFKIPGTDTAFRMPKPHEFSIVGNMAWRLVDMAVKDDPITKELFLPALARTLTNEFYFTPFPQVITPVAELIADKDFFTGRPIEGLMKEFASPTERRRLYTSPTAIAASREMFGKIPIDALKLSPIQIEHLIKGYTGFLGEAALFMSDLVVSRAYDLPSAPARRITDYPVAKSFFQRTPLRNTVYGNIIYQHFKTMEQAYADISTARRAGDMGRMEELIEENRDAVYWNKFIKQNKRRLAEISARVKQVRNSMYMDPEAKRQEIERLEQIRNLIAKQTVETVLR